HQFLWKLYKTYRPEARPREAVALVSVAALAISALIYGIMHPHYLEKAMNLIALSGFAFATFITPHSAEDPAYEAAMRIYTNKTLWNKTPISAAATSTIYHLKNLYRFIGE